MLPPVELVYLRQSGSVQHGAVAEPGEITRPVCLLEPAQGFQIEVVVVIVRDQHQVDRRQRLKRQARVAHAPRADVPQRTDALGVHRVGEDIEAGQLDQKGNVIDERERELPRSKARRQGGPDPILDAPRPGPGPRGNGPAQQVQPTASGAGVRIEKMPAVEMVREPTVVRRTARLRPAGERRNR